VFDGRADDALAGQFVEAPGIAYLRADPRESRDIIEFASGLLFPSEAARRSARETDLARLPHAVLRLPVPSGRGAPEPLAAKPVLVVPGAMPGDERLDRIVEAFALVLPDWRGRLLFLGSADPASRRRLMDSGRRLGVEREVSWTDRVPHDEYRGRLAAAWCAVCLGARWSSGGDRPLLDALAAGIPVVSDRADAAELAEDGVVALAGPAPVGELAAALRGLLEPAARSARAAEARRYAATWNASAFADALVASLEDLAAPARPFVAAP
ncbi:MAG TPA: glycosyltransferase, partial [Acidimicrobiia bacterium]|nr:glycosyltransferase [Acidimicrobiia bacterium]